MSRATPAGTWMGALTWTARGGIGPPSLRRSQGQVAEWLKAADCKSARVSVRWFESSPVHHRRRAGIIQNRDGCAGAAAAPAVPVMITATIDALMPAHVVSTKHVNAA